MTLELRDAGEPYYTFIKIHKDFYNRLKTDTRLTSEYRIDTWQQGRFNISSLPPTGVHARYERLDVAPFDETSCYYGYKIGVIVWVLINHRDMATQYDLAELYLGRITQIFTEQPDDWSLDGTVTNIEFIRADYAQDWNARGGSVLLCSVRFAISADIEHLNTQS